MPYPLTRDHLRSFQESQIGLQEPPRPYEELKNSITTRTLASKMRERDEKELSSTKLRSGSSLTSSSRSTSSRFLTGAAVPNSVVRSESNQFQTLRVIDDKKAAREKRDQFVQELITRVKPRMYNQLYKDPEYVPETREISVGTSPTKLSTIDFFDTVSEEGDETERKLKEKMRIARRTSSLIPIDHNSRPTLESIRHAIENTPTISDIIDIDTIESMKRTGEEIVTREKKEVKENKDSKKMSPIPSMLTVYSNRQPSLASSASKASKSLANKGKTKKTPSVGVHKLGRTSILKDSTKPSSKPHRSVSIIETKQREDTQTQTYIKMSNLKPK